MGWFDQQQGEDHAGGVILGVLVVDTDPRTRSPEAGSSDRDERNDRG